MTPVSGAHQEQDRPSNRVQPAPAHQCSQHFSHWTGAASAPTHYSLLRIIILKLKYKHQPPAPLTHNAISKRNLQ